jgi:tRNA modification GTPase
MMTGDTIAAIATAPGEGGIAIIRISGPQALLVADRVFSCRGRPPSQRPTQTFTWGHIKDQEKHNVDEGLLLIMRAPHSYTREDVVELQCHGGMITPRQVLRVVLQAGARMADPGEFTYRAFINGRMDLVQAESVNDLIRARSDRAVRLAQEQREGRLSQQFNELYQYLLPIATDLEATLDFPDDELPPAVLPEILNKIESVMKNIGELLAHWQEGHRVREGLSLVISGRPNVGKSSILNSLLGKNRAIVSHQPGTTRDVIEESYYVEGVQIRIIDTAGLRISECVVEQEGIRRAHNQLQQADLFLYVFDASQPLAEDDLKTINSLPKGRGLLVANKVDLGKIVQKSSLNDFLVVNTSSLLQTGIEQLKKEIEIIVSCFVNLKSMPETIVSERHFHLLNQARHDLRDGILILRESNDHILAAHHVRLAIRNVAQIVGNDVTADIFSSIFSKFCIGK